MRKSQVVTAALEETVPFILYKKHTCQYGTGPGLYSLTPGDWQGTAMEPEAGHQHQPWSVGGLRLLSARRVGARTERRSNVAFVTQFRVSAGVAGAWLGAAWHCLTCHSVDVPQDSVLEPRSQLFRLECVFTHTRAHTHGNVRNWLR